MSQRRILLSFLLIFKSCLRFSGQCLVTSHTPRSSIRFEDEFAYMTRPDPLDGIYSIPMPYEEIHNSLPISSLIFPGATYDEEPPSYSEAIKNFHPLESRVAHIT